MKNKLLVFLCFGFLAKAVLATNWEAAGFKVLSQSNQDDYTIWSLSSKKSYKIEARSRKTLEADQIRKLASLNQVFEKFTSIQIASVLFTVEDSIVEAHVTPESIAYKQKNYVTNVAGGILFESSKSVQYTFRIVSNEVAVKIDGYFRDETELLEKVALAVNDPKAYLRERDPQYLHSQLENFRLEMQKALQLKSEEIENVRKEAKDIHQKQLDQFEKLRKAVIALSNQGWFSGPKLVEEAKIQKIVALKQADPKLTIDQIKEELKKQNIDAASKEVELVLIVFFNEIED